MENSILCTIFDKKSTKIFYCVLLDVPPQAQLEIKVELTFLENILYVAPVVEIILDTRFGIDTQLGENVKLHTRRTLRRPLHAVSRGLLCPTAVFFHGTVAHAHGSFCSHRDIGS